MADPQPPKPQIDASTGTSIDERLVSKLPLSVRVMIWNLFKESHKGPARDGACFNSLPTEIRLQIWQCAGPGPQMMPVYHCKQYTGSNFDDMYRPLPKRLIRPLAVNKESYFETKRLIRHAERDDDPGTLSFRPQIDVLYLNGKARGCCRIDRESIDWVEFLKRLSSQENGPSLRSVAVDLYSTRDYWCYSPHTPNYSLWTQNALEPLKKLKEIIFVVGEAARETRFKVLEYGVPVDPGDGTWGRGFKSERIARANVIENFMKCMEKTARTTNELPVVKMMVLHKLRRNVTYY